MMVKYALVAAMLSTGLAQATTNYWKANTSYPAKSEVVYNNILWTSQKNNSNINPSADPEKIWLKIGTLVKPSNAPSNWAASAAYADTTTVIYNGALWQAISANYNKVPSIESQFWIKQATAGQKTIGTQLALMASTATAPTPSPANQTYWQASAIYLASTTVIYNSTTWQARWYSQGERPGSIGSAWIKITTAQATSTPPAAQGSTPVLTTRPTVAATPVATITPTATPTPESLIRTFHLNKPGLLANNHLQAIDREPLISTGLWVNVGDIVTISYYYQTIAPAFAPSIAVHDLTEEIWNYTADQKQELKIGSNVLQVTKTGLLFIASNNKPNVSEMIIEVVSGGQSAK